MCTTSPTFCSLDEHLLHSLSLTPLHDSPLSTTYNSPPLAGKDVAEFDVVEVELWRMGPPPRRDEDDSGGPSVLDGNLEDKMVLQVGKVLSLCWLVRCADTCYVQLAGRQMHSEALREAPDDDDENDASTTPGATKRVVY